MRAGTLSIAVLLSSLATMHAHPRAEAQAAAERGQLLVWRVVDTSTPRAVSPGSLDPHVKSQTAGSFGQPSSTFGQTAGSTGQTASSLGQTASSTGQTAGSTGQTAGSFGESLGTLAAAAERSNGSAVPIKDDPEWEKFTSGTRNEFRALSIVFEDVAVDDLEAKLHERSPDVLVGTPFPSSWSNQGSGLVRRYGLATLGVVDPLPQEESPEPASNGFKVQASVLRAASNPRAARAFVLWLYSKNLCSGCERIAAEAQTPAALAKSALFDILNGQRLGITADRETAPFNAPLAQQTALNTSAPALLVGLNISIDATGAAANARFAVVALRAVLVNTEAFGVVHAVVVLRTDDAGKWHVLQITPNLQVQQQAFAWLQLRPYSATVAPGEVARVLGATQAAPTDGDSREASPEFWWDNRGGATLEIVEWQRKAADNWTGSNLFFVPDENGHLRTRVTGRFANSPGPYRWRIWSVGRGGVIVISPWRSLNVISH